MNFCYILVTKNTVVKGNLLLLPFTFLHLYFLSYLIPEIAESSHEKDIVMSDVHFTSFVKI